MTDDVTQVFEVATPDERPPIELTEAALEALLFVAERPLTRREIATRRDAREPGRASSKLPFPFRDFSVACTSTLLTVK